MARRYQCYRDFLTEDERRRTRAVEIGHDWKDGAARFRVCFYPDTNELTAERLAEGESLDLEDFERGIASVEIVGVLRDRAELNRLLGPWPTLDRCRPRTLARLKELVGDRRLHVLP